MKGSADPELLYDWSRALRQEHKDADAHKMLMRVKPAKLLREHTARWWGEINLQARDMLRDKDAKGALAMLRHAGLSAGNEYVDQQFLAGFIALRLVKDPAAALPYFQRLTSAVARPPVQVPPPPSRDQPELVPTPMVCAISCRAVRSFI